MFNASIIISHYFALNKTAKRGNCLWDIQHIITKFTEMCTMKILCMGSKKNAAK